MWFRLVAWCLCATFPSTDELVGLDRMEVVPFLRQMDRDTPLIMRLALLGSILVFLLSPLLTVGLPLPAPLLGKATLQRHVERLAGHRIYLLRQTMMMVKTVAGLLWGADPQVRRALGMDPYRVDPGTWRAQ